MSNLESVAGEVALADEAVLKVLPYISFALGFTPAGPVAAPIMPLVTKVLQKLDDAAKIVAAAKPDATPEEVLQEVMDQLDPTKPNSPILSLPAA